jgi:hypothetical protein
LRKDALSNAVVRVIETEMRHAKAQTTQTGSISEDEVLQVAREEMSKRGWGRMELTGSKTTNGWTVYAWKLPKVPDADMVLEISNAGEVLIVQPVP